MSLQEFEFIESAIDILRNQQKTLEEIEYELVKFFASIPLKENELMSVSSRIKSESSLKEKIIRNRYLIDYDDPEVLFSEIPDIIGVRIECKFVRDEKDIFMQIKNYFKQTDDRKFFYAKSNKNIRLYLFEKQPLKQKNGFEIYKIDGEYRLADKKIKFELQIKALVNVFWSEIEHKIIYKNTTYLLEDQFIKDMMISIKNNLTMIDDQLLSIYKNFKPDTKLNSKFGRDEIKTVFSKLLYDTITYKMDEQLSFSIDFKKPCETILDYSLQKYEDSIDGLSAFMTEEYKKINEFLNKDINFNDGLVLEHEPKFDDAFSRDIANIFIDKMNIEVPWNLFFRILFELEPDNNVDDFSNFVRYFKRSLITKDSLYDLMDSFGEYSIKIIEDMYDCIYKVISKVGRIDIFFDVNLTKMRKTASEGLDYVCYEFETYYEYMEQKRIISKIMVDSLMKIYN